MKNEWQMNRSQVADSVYSVVELKNQLNYLSQRSYDLEKNLDYVSRMAGILAKELESLNDDMSKVLRNLEDNKVEIEEYVIKNKMHEIMDKEIKEKESNQGVAKEEEVVDSKGTDYINYSKVKSKIKVDPLLL